MTYPNASNGMVDARFEFSKENETIEMTMTL